MHDRTYDDQQHRAAGCNLVVAAITLWNTVYLAAAVEALRRSGVDVPDDLLRHVWPLGWDHVTLTGDYRWSADNPKALDQLRPLRLERLGMANPAYRGFWNSDHATLSNPQQVGCWKVDLENAPPSAASANLNDDVDRPGSILQHIPSGLPISNPHNHEG